MVIIELMRRVVGLAQGATAEVAVYGDRDRDLAERWCANTGNTLVRADVDQTGVGTLVVRRGHPPDPASVLGPDRLPGVRLWLYTNFHCNLCCDYCCVSSSPSTPHRELGAERIGRIVGEAARWGVRELFLTGGEPFLLPDIDTIIATCVKQLPTTVLTNGMVFKGRGRRALESLPRGLALQISLDSATPELHDAHRGAGTWVKAVAGIRLALFSAPTSCVAGTRHRHADRCHVGGPAVRCRRAGHVGLEPPQHRPLGRPSGPYHTANNGRGQRRARCGIESDVTDSDAELADHRRRRNPCRDARFLEPLHRRAGRSPGRRGHRDGQCRGQSGELRRSLRHRPPQRRHRHLPSRVADRRRRTCCRGGL